VGMAADKAGLAPGMKVVAVNGRRYNEGLLVDAVKAAESPVELLMENGEYFSVAKVDYDGGMKIPHLERDEAHEDVLTKILLPSRSRSERDHRRPSATSRRIASTDHLAVAMRPWREGLARAMRRA